MRRLHLKNLSDHEFAGLSIRSLSYVKNFHSVEANSTRLLSIWSTQIMSHCFVLSFYLTEFFMLVRSCFNP